MAMSINKSWIAIIVLFTVLLSGGFFPAALPAFQEPPPGPPISEEDRIRMLERLRERMNENRQTDQPFPDRPAQQEQPDPSTESGSAQPQVNLEPAAGTLTLNFINQPLSTFIKEISELLGLTPLLVDSGVQGTVTMYTSAPISTDDVLALFHLILKTKNASLIEQNGIYQVVPISSALRTGIDLIEHQTPEYPTPSMESSEIPLMSINVVSVEFIPVKDLIEPIQLFMTEGGVIMPYERLNMLILADYSDSAERIVKIIQMLDNRYMDPELIDLVKIENNASADVAMDLQKLFGTGENSTSSGVKFISLDRMNTIFVMGGSRRALEEAKSWIEILDTTTGRKIQNNVYIVQNSTASYIATMLSAYYGGEQLTETSEIASSVPGSGSGRLGENTGQQQGSFGTFSSAASGGSNNSQGGIFGGGNFGTGGFGTGSQLNPQFNVSEGISSVIIQGGEFSGLQETIRLVVDNVNNRLFIQSTSADYAFILEAIQQMDIAPRQVVINASIYEVDLNDELAWGIGATLRERTGGSMTQVGVNTVVDGIPTGIFSAANIALVGNSLELVTALNALREKTNVRILENPSLLALDGVEASFTVGQEIPYPGSSYTQPVGGTTTSIQYRNTGITLYIRPKISASGSVELDVLQEISSFGTTTSLGPTFNKSQVRTTLTVRDGETAAIAGLIRDTDSLSRTGFPIISDIPFIGGLFGQTKKDKRRSELIILITPQVIHNPDEFQEFTEEFRHSMRNIRQFANEKQQQEDEYFQAEEDALKKEEEERLKEEEKKKEEAAEAEAEKNRKKKD